MEIDLEKIKETMKKNGFTWSDTDNLDGWTDSLVDAIEEEYNLESQLINLFSEEKENAENNC